MPTTITRYVDPDAVGLGDGTSLANAYTTLAAAILAEIKDLVAADEIMNFVCASTAGTADVSADISLSSSWTTDSTRYIHISPYTGNEAGTEWDATKYRLQMNTSATSGFFRDMLIDNIQIEDTYASGSHIMTSFRTGGSNYREVRKCYWKYSGAGGSSNRFFSWGSDVAILISNNIFDGNPNKAFENQRVGGPQSFIYSNTFVNNGLAIDFTTADLAVLKNNIFGLNTSDVVGTYAAGTDYNTTNNASIGYTVTGGANANDRTSQTFTTTSPTDYSITGADTGARTHGIDLTSDPDYPFPDDTNGTLRGGTWDMGSFQITPPGIILTGPDTITQGAVETATGTFPETVTGINLRTTVGGYSLAQTLGSQTPTSVDYTANTGVNDCTPGSPTPGVPLEPTLPSAGITPWQLQQQAVDGINFDISRNLVANGEATHEVIQTTIADAHTIEGQSIFAPSIVAVEDNHQAYVPKSANGMNITWLPNGTFTTDADQTETIQVIYFSPATGNWGCIDLTITDTSVIPSPVDESTLFFRGLYKDAFKSIEIEIFDTLH